jgi:hypothetical protein
MDSSVIGDSESFNPCSIRTRIGSNSLQADSFLCSLLAMKFSPSKSTGAALVAAFLVFPFAERAFSQASPPDSSPAPQESSPEQSQALLQKVKAAAMERRIVTKQTEIDQLKADLDQTKKDLDASQKNLDATNALIAASNSNMDKLTAERKRLQQQLDLTDLRVEAEQKQGDGLKRLSTAQTDELDAINLRMSEIGDRTNVRKAELQLLSAGKPVPGEDNDENGAPDFYKLKKTLALDEQKTASAEAIARAAMNAASARLALAEEAAARVTQVSDEMVLGKPEPVAEKTGETAPASTPAASPAPKHHHKKSASPGALASPGAAPASPKPDAKNPWWMKK